jgi:hypothetical protein
MSAATEQTTDEEREIAYQALQNYQNRSVLCETSGHEGAWMWLYTDVGIHVFRQICKRCGKLSNLILAPELET